MLQGAFKGIQVQGPINMFYKSVLIFIIHTFPITTQVNLQKNSTNKKQEQTGWITKVNQICQSKHCSLGVEHVVREISLE